VEYEKEQL
jgi:hypothetical protein